MATVRAAHGGDELIAGISRGTLRPFSALLRENGITNGMALQCMRMAREAEDVAEAA